RRLVEVEAVPAGDDVDLGVVAEELRGPLAAEIGVELVLVLRRRGERAVGEVDHRPLRARRLTAEADRALVLGRGGEGELAEELVGVAVSGEARAVDRLVGGKAGRGIEIGDAVALAGALLAGAVDLAMPGGGRHRVAVAVAGAVEILARTIRVVVI